MNRALAGVLLLLLVPMALVSCSVGAAAREAGGAAFDGARDAAVAYIHSPEATAFIKDTAASAAEVGAAKLKAVASDPSVPPWEATAAGLAALALSAYASYQRGHRTGEDKGFTDGTGNGATAPKT